jgi:hypothetical protein
MIPVSNTLPVDSILLTPDPIQGRWLQLAREPWTCIFKKLSFADLQNCCLVGKLFNQVIRTRSVADERMERDGFEFRSDESWLRTYSRRKILIAVDLSSSMYQGSENWRMTVAVKEVKAIVSQFKMFAAEIGIDCIAFSTASARLKLNNEQEILDHLFLITENNNAEGGIGTANDWARTMSDIRAYVSKNKTFRNTVYLLSDMESFVPRIETHQFWTRVFDEEVSVRLCCIGNSEIGKTTYDTLLRTPTTFVMSSFNKKFKISNNLTIKGKHILSKDGEIDVPPLLLAPTEILEEQDPFFGLQPMAEDDDDSSEESFSDFDVSDRNYINDEQEFPDDHLI